MYSLVLGSASPRRSDLLKQAGLSFTVRPAEVEEFIDKSMTPNAAVLHLAEKKNQALNLRNKEVILTADTVVVWQDNILGKPSSYHEANQMLNNLSGSWHNVYTGVCIRNEVQQRSFEVCTRVKFFPLTHEEIERYLEHEEAWDKAGAYGIQGKGGLFVERIEGDYLSVVGLPLSRVVRELGRFNIGIG
ncbi:Maf family protein [Halobacillus rhizosphaerae]|uniref:Maf family protein n=1 Tax=Halobacillus rhizosphaerae TaxID=3064889 RepID=UPI00398B15DB